MVAKKLAVEDKKKISSAKTSEQECGVICFDMEYNRAV